ncbi:putative benzoate 4-monooxygenase cytochrome P450 [Blumeria hordei DH14]|uniref:Putative benzoate 4-monooxygenase cytochrome P450 n=1 Tax=Blumeria graminis f. sp. hordei (strain DH14) TaxID=546991 RepID=N1JDI6_BLUG1|nr:putative benzoate 4-monooxygenase cytochrome P450 [Blumeria hordei DH14]
MISFSLFATISVAGLIYVSVRAIYSFYTDPLRKYPGPLLNRITYVVRSYHLLRGDYVFYLQDLHRKYGLVVRISPTELSYIDVQAWTDIYAQSTTRESGNLPKGTRNLRFEDNGAVSIFNAKDADHRRIRRIQNHMFSEKAIAGQEPLIKTYTDLLISILREKASNPSTSVVNLVDWYNYTTFDIIGELAFGESFECLRYLYRLTPSKIRNALCEASDFAKEKASARMARDSVDRVDFMSYILKHNDEKGMTKPEIENNARFLILAGSETTSSFLSGITFHLLTNPQHLVKLTNLIRDTFSTPSEITGAATFQLEYLNALIEESFRLYPPTTSASPRNTTSGGKIICGEVMPQNVSVSVPILAANTSPYLWTDPDDFVPERWYKGDKCPEKYRNDERKAMQPFSLGPRNCIGKHMAKQEIRLILAAMLWNFDLELQPESLDWKKSQKVFGLWERPALNVRLTPRDHKV